MKMFPATMGAIDKYPQFSEKCARKCSGKTCHISILLSNDENKIENRNEARMMRMIG
jgi:hypothetical protein